MKNDSFSNLCQTIKRDFCVKIKKQLYFSRRISRFTSSTNRYAVNRVKLLDKSPAFRNHLLTYDTSGQDWTLRIWDMDRDDTLITSFTCASRIVSCDISLPVFYHDASAVAGSHPPMLVSAESTAADSLLLVVALYGFKDLLVLRLVKSGASVEVTKSPQTRHGTSSPTSDESCIIREFCL